MNPFKKSVLSLLLLPLFGQSWADSPNKTTCPAGHDDPQAIQISQGIMDSWFSGVENGDLKSVDSLFSPQAVILHSVGGPMTKADQMKLLVGFHLGGYQFTNFCATTIGSDVIVATFDSKTFNHDESKTGLNFLSDSSAYRMVVLQKQDSKTRPWLIIAYANMNPLTQAAPEIPNSEQNKK